MQFHYFARVCNIYSRLMSDDDDFDDETGGKITEQV